MRPLHSGTFTSEYGRQVPQVYGMTVKEGEKMQTKMPKSKERCMKMLSQHFSGSVLEYVCTQTKLSGRKGHC